MVSLPCCKLDPQDYAQSMIDVRMAETQHNNHREHSDSLKGNRSGIGERETASLTLWTAESVLHHGCLKCYPEQREVPA